MSYELQLYALSPERPTPRELLAAAGESGVQVELEAAPGVASSLDDTSWSKLLLRSAESNRGGFLVELSGELDKMKEQFRTDRQNGETIPDQVMAASRLYVLELDDESPRGEDHQAAFVVTAWGLAGLTEAIVFDPQEEFFADAESFWEILTDSALGDDDEDAEDGDDAADGESPDNGALDDDAPRFSRELTILPGGRDDASAN